MKITISRSLEKSILFMQRYGTVGPPTPIALENIYAQFKRNEPLRTPSSCPATQTIKA